MKQRMRKKATYRRICEGRVRVVKKLMHKIAAERPRYVEYDEGHKFFASRQQERATYDALRLTEAEFKSLAPASPKPLQA